MHNILFTKMHLIISCANWWPVCPGGDEFTLRETHYFPRSCWPFWITSNGSGNVNQYHNRQRNSRYTMFILFFTNSVPADGLAMNFEGHLPIHSVNLMWFLFVALHIFLCNITSWKPYIIKECVHILLLTGQPFTNDFRQQKWACRIRHVSH